LKPGDFDVARFGFGVEPLGEVRRGDGIGDFRGQIRVTCVIGDLDDVAHADAHAVEPALEGGHEIVR
jgi:hypothetical protein